MKLFNIFKKPNFNRSIKDFKKDPNAILLDVRSVKEYESGHVPGSHNLPLKSIGDVASVTANKDATLYVYCQSGARSKQAVAALKSMGYSNVRNIGGMASYHGEIEK